MTLSVLFEEIEILSNFLQFSDVSRSIEIYWVVNFGFNLFWIDLSLIFRLRLYWFYVFFLWRFFFHKIINFLNWGFRFLDILVFHFLYLLLNIEMQYDWSRVRLFLIGWSRFLWINGWSRFFIITFCWLHLLSFFPGRRLHTSK